MESQGQENENAIVLVFMSAFYSLICDPERAFNLVGMLFPSSSLWILSPHPAATGELQGWEGAMKTRGSSLGPLTECEGTMKMRSSWLHPLTFLHFFLHIVPGSLSSVDVDN